MPDWTASSNAAAEAVIYHACGHLTEGFRNLRKLAKLPKDPHLVELWERVERNLKRSRFLLELYSEQTGKSGGRRSLEELDLLRAAVVLSHATLEDFLRSIAAETFPKSNKEILNGIPLLESATGAPSKFLLGELSQYRGMTVDDLLQKSVNAHLERASFNNIQDIMQVIKAAGVQPHRFEKQLPKLAALTRRRHHIVHQADRNLKSVKGFYGQAISVKKVWKWTNAVESFARTFCREIERERNRARFTPPAPSSNVESRTEGTTQAARSPFGSWDTLAEQKRKGR